MRTDLQELKTFLEKEYSKKLSLNSAYSQKAFARDLGVSATALNEFLAGKRDLSSKNIGSIFSYLNSKVHCSWCDKEKKDTKFLVGGPRNQFICDSCLDECGKIIKDSGLMVSV